MTGWQSFGPGAVNERPRTEDIVVPAPGEHGDAPFTGSGEPAATTTWLSTGRPGGGPMRAAWPPARPGSSSWC